MADSQLRIDPPLYNSSAVPYDPALPVQQRRPMLAPAALPSSGVAHRTTGGAQPYRTENKSPETSKRLDDMMLQYQQQQQQKLYNQTHYNHPSQSLLPAPTDHAYLTNHYAGTSGGRMLVRDNQAAAGMFA